MIDFIPIIVILVLFIVTMGILKKRKHQRAASLLYLLLFSAWLIYLGDRWKINFISAKYLGFVLGGVAVLGLVGVNIWYGGPLDRRNDPSETAAEEDP